MSTCLHGKEIKTDCLACKKLYESLDRGQERKDDVTRLREALRVAASDFARLHLAAWDIEQIKLAAEAAERRTLAAIQAVMGKDKT